MKNTLPNWLKWGVNEINNIEINNSNIINHFRKNIKHQTSNIKSHNYCTDKNDVIIKVFEYVIIPQWFWKS